MKSFNRQELLIVGTILLVLISVSLQNFKISLRRARDAQRKADLREILSGLELYRDDFGFYPLNTKDGEIMACEKDVIDEKMAKSIVLKEKLLATFDKCEWGEDSLTDISDPDYPDYLARLPKDPDWQDGSTYRYISNTRIFQIYASLEGVDEPEYQNSILAREIDCGSEYCNFGRSPNNVPLDKSLEEYENESSRDL